MVKYTGKQPTKEQDKMASQLIKLKPGFTSGGVVKNNDLRLRFRDGTTVRIKRNGDVKSVRKRRKK